MDDIACIVDLVEPKISPEMLVILDSPFSSSEVKRAVFDIGSTKSPELNGFHAVCFQCN